MRNYLKAATVIEQCTRCYALRDTKNEPGECKSCRALLNVRHTEVRWLAFGQPSSDASPMPVTFDVRAGQQAGRALCIN